jgi:hypothetical protein
MFVLLMLGVKKYKAEGTFSSKNFILMCRNSVSSKFIVLRDPWLLQNYKIILEIFRAR